MKRELKNPEDIKSIEELKEEIEKVLLLEDEGITHVVVATVIANRMNLDPLWLMLIAPPGGGKTEFINTLTGLAFVHMISDITVNTFLSGQKKVGKETSLLLKVNNGLLAFKDFTSILSKDKETKKTLMAQLREIFDGEFTKRTGTGDDPTWKGKVGAIAGATEAIYRHLEDMSAMGDRFVMYNVKQPNREELAARVLENAHDMIDFREHMKACVVTFINRVLETLDDEEIHLSKETKRELFEIANFATLVRSAVMTDFKSGLIDFVPAPEMPTRVTQQLYTMASALIAIEKVAPVSKQAPAHKGELNDFQKRILYKTAFDSIPRTRRDALRPLAEYKQGITSAGFAAYIGLPTASATKYLAQLNALGIVTRVKEGGKHGDKWSLKEEKFRDIIVKLEGINVKDETLLAAEVEDDDFDDDWDSVPDFEQDSLDTSL